MLFIGHTRFSLFEPNSGAWRASNRTKFKTVDEYKAYLFSDERLSQRTKIFLEESLPQIDAAKGAHDIQHVVSYSDLLPHKYQEKLERAADQYPFLVLDKHVNSQATHSLSDVAISAVEKFQPEGGLFGRYRLDDDDILPVTYFDQMAPYITAEHVGWMVSLGSGFTGIRLGNHYYDIRRAYYAMLAIGLLSICQVDRSGEIVEPYGGPHTHSDRKNPVILDSRTPGYFWGKHPHQDTALTQGARVNSEVINQIRDSISHYPPAHDPNLLKKLFPEVSPKMHLEGSPAETAKNQISNEVLLDEAKISFSYDVNKGMLGVAGTVVCSGEPRPHNALLSFELIRSDGSPLPADAAPEMLKTGIYRSEDTSIGYYRYIPTEPGERSFDYVFELPQGVSCRNVSVRRFGKGESGVKLTRLSLYDPLPE